MDKQLVTWGYSVDEDGWMEVEGPSPVEGITEKQAFDLIKHVVKDQDRANEIIEGIKSSKE